MSQPIRSRYSIPIALRLVLGLIVLIIIGTLLFMLPGMTTRPIRLIDAFFTAVSALCVTGLSTIIPARDLTLAGQIVLLLQIQIGGVGFMATAAIIVTLFGRRLSLTNRLALSDSLGLPNPSMIMQLTGRVIVAVLVLEAFGTLLLYLGWRERLGEQALFYAVFHAISAFCNAGFDLFGGLPDYPTGIPTDTASIAPLGLMIVLGGLGIPVLGDLLTWRPGRRLQLHTRITLLVVVVLIMIGWIGIWFDERQPGALLAGQPLGRQLELSLFQSISARTAGFAGIQPFEELRPASQLLIGVLMFIGCAPASMGGGITTGTFVVLMLTLIANVRRQADIQVQQRMIPRELVRKASAILVISLVVVVTATWLLLVSHPLTVAEAIFEVISAFATCGLTLAVTGQLNEFGLIVVAFMMFWGRLGALTLVLALAQPHTALVRYPEESVLIG